MKHSPERLVLANYPWAQTMETRYGDQDPNRHLNNVAISRFFEEARVRFNWHLLTAGPPLDRPRYLVAHVGIDYLGEGHYPGAVTLGYGVIHIGTSSFRAAKAMFQHDKCIALCESVLVHRGEAAPAPLPQALHDRLLAFRFPTGASQ
ncbi:thioesterase [Polymorphobacter multimanifer]|uniref:acyl-CoA thioesterase n=1 Tax=Polymorphobacter multimanifer TaxID=1070431 RepID=UPI00166AB7F7|nr:acyl-CoA thioesterase [Polymorphobacter multimanifer]GGI93957.1 thioesterase [Polymorphobacter multimanifer]